ncbi:MAG: hypothetical protein HYY58_02210 [Candidatus Omnitrophica bacterium]|nr:hypothetical protein [Candidatus Omnitrophota bacterium]
MVDQQAITTIGLIAGTVLPLWNIPLIVRIGRRKSSRDLSLPWAVGVLTCVYLMLPAALASADLVFKVFSVVNAVLFTAVVVQIIRYRS